MRGDAFRFRAVRDGVLLADLPGASEEQANRACVALAERLRASRMRGLLDAVPAACSLLLIFDPDRVGAARVRSEAESAGERGAQAGSESTRLLRVPVAYVGADLAELARGAAISSEEFARRHCGVEYRVAFLGFAPGFAYLTGLPAELSAARLSSPRPRVPSGSVAIGGSYTGVYPATSPGGWRLIGQTTARLFDPDADPPALWGAGDRVRFEPVRLEDLPVPQALSSRPAPEGLPVFRVLSPGVSTTIQGAPADGRRASGIPAGGAMNAQALARANTRVGNPRSEPGLEIALVGPELEALAPCVVALEGAEVEAWVNGKPESASSEWTLSPGDRVRLGRVGGAFAYLAVQGGLLPLARYAPQPRFSTGDTVARGIAEPAAPSEPLSSPSSAESSGELRLRTLPGPEADHYAPAERERFYRESWRVSRESDRRGTRLEGAIPLRHEQDPEIPPSGTVPGSIQVPGGGQPIVLGPDGPVTGGYPRLATVIGADLPLLGRARAGIALRFVEVTLAAALEARRPSGSTMRLP